MNHQIDRLTDALARGECEEFYAGLTNDVELIFMSLVARNERYYGKKLHEIIGEFELRVIADTFFDGRLVVAMAFMHSDDAVTIAEAVDRQRLHERGERNGERR